MTKCVMPFATTTDDSGYASSGRSRLSRLVGIVRCRSHAEGCAYPADAASLTLIRGIEEREGNEADAWRSWQAPTLFAKCTHHQA